MTNYPGELYGPRRAANPDGGDDDDDNGGEEEDSEVAPSYQLRKRRYR